MRIHSLKRLAPYGVAVLSVALATVVRLELDPLLGESAPLLIFAIAVILTSWLGGFWPGALATALSLLVIDYLFFEPKYSIFGYDSRLDQIRAIFFGIFGMLFSLIIARLRENIKAEMGIRERVRLLVEGVKDYAIFMLDAQGRVASWNPGAERIKGYRANEIIGRDFSIFYTPEDVESGMPQRILEIAATEGSYDESGWQIRKDGSRFWASGVIAAAQDDRGRLFGFTVITRDITERKMIDEKIRFLADLNQALRPLSDPEEIMAAAARMLGEYLGVDRCAYAEVEANENYLEITSDYTRGDIPSIVGRFRVDDLGVEALRLMRADRPYAVSDIKTEDSARWDISAYRQAAVRALMCAPLIKNGHYVARMAVSQNSPRRWETWEINLVAKVANRCWESVERARAVRSLRESEERYRAFIANSSEAIWRFELEQPIPITLPEDEQIEMLYRFGYLAECNDAMARMYGYENADQIVGARIGDLLPRSDPRNIAYLRALKRSGYRLTDAETYEIDRHGKTKYFLSNQIGIVENGAVVRSWGIQRDITERKEAEEERSESEERYRLLTEISPDGVVIASADGTIHLANQAMQRMLGVAPEHVIGRNFCDFFPPGAADQYRDFLDDLMICDLPEGRIEMAFRRDNGQILPVEISAVRFDWKGRQFAQFIIHDISRRRQAEAERERLHKEIEAERNRLRQILEQMPIGVAIAEAPSGRLIFHNHEAESLWRHPLLPSDDYRGYARYGALSDDGSPYRAEDYPLSRALICGEVIKGEEVRYRRGDGTETILSIDSAPINDPEGRRVLAVATFIDIAERKQAEEAIRESEERFAKAFRASPDGLVISRIADGLILEVNESWTKLSGYDWDELIGKSTLDLGLYVDPADRPRLLAILKEQNYVRDFEFLLRRKTGEARLVTFSAEPLELHGEHCWLTIVRDITERKQAEEALRESEEQARRQLAHVEAIYATAPVGLCILDTDLRFLRINKLLAEIDGKSVEEHLGRTVREVVPDVADVVETALWRVIDTGGPALNVEYRFVLAAQPGAIRDFIASYYPIKNGSGQALGVNVVVLEITERKKIEEELEHLLGEEKAAREEAEAVNRMKDEFLATISHELRTPLTSILGWAHTLTRGELTAAQTRHALEVITQSAQSQTQLIEDILDTSRIITGRFTLDAKPVAIENIFHAAVDVVRSSAEAKGIVLNESADAPESMVLGDAKRLQQAIWNLLSNAIKFTIEGGRIEASLGRAEGQVEITVTDTGIGIDPKFLPHVFDRFRQADASSTREYGGLGIGLAIVRHIIEMHGGGVSASSSGKGQGATFKIRLPLISASRLTQPEGPPVEVTTAKEPEVLEEGDRLDGVRVLVVEDNPDTLDMLKFIFDESGAEVITAASVDEALDALDRFKPDALVSDIAMPDRDGYDLIREIRSREPERGGKIPAVAVTAYARTEDRVRALTAGFQMHITKPISPDELITVVASLTGHIHYGSVGDSEISAPSSHWKH
jgi:PAS domain S-box-containing protein